jgi:uncharacterized protein
MRLQVNVKTGQKVDAIQHSDGQVTVLVKDLPIEGRANNKVVKILAKEFKVAKNKVKIVTGQRSNYKTVSIDT